jgi:hypothetical protein
MEFWDESAEMINTSDIFLFILTYSGKTKWPFKTPSVSIWNITLRLSTYIFWNIPKFRKRSHNIRHASFSIVPRVMKKARSWRSLEFSVGVLRLRKCYKIRNFHRKKVCTPSKCESRSAIIKFQKYSIQKSWKKLKVLNFSYDHIKTNH